MALGEQVPDAVAGAAAVVEQYRVGEQAAGGPVEEDHRHAHLDLDAQERVVEPGRHHEQAVDPA